MATLRGVDWFVALPDDEFMNPQAMVPFGEALRAYFEGDTDAQLINQRDDGQATPIPVSVFFREPRQFTPIDRAALDRCAGDILDVGAGTGLHSLVLQERGKHVTAIDVNPGAVQVIRAGHRYLLTPEFVMRRHAVGRFSRRHPSRG